MSPAVSWIISMRSRAASRLRIPTQPRVARAARASALEQVAALTMTDYFALLNEKRRPWINPDSLKQKFLALSSGVHPDRVHNSGESEKRKAQELYTNLNAAYNCLREPKSRLQHLLELEQGFKPANIETIPPDLMELFMEVSRVCREADAFLAE